ncbi:autotransporter domain-containing protein [Candidatus Ruminimicrobium bovinum]|uniref:autotransporter domain-containing protein n=1 Tax=Candidatus Ruminimicrobium bovinum TaxID=3242779 RepID=UPI0039B9C276
MKNKLLIICFLFLSVNLFATTHYEITTSSSVSNQSYENYYQQGYGGVFSVIESGKLTLDNTNFYNNASHVSNGIYCDGRGGAIYLDNYYNVTANITLSIFNNNYSFGNGGAIYIRAQGIQRINSTVFIENTAKGWSQKYSSTCGCGGAIYNGVGQVLISSTIFIGNIAKAEQINGATGSTTNYYGYGGAIYNIKTVTILDGTKFENNIAKTEGGAIYNLGTNASAGTINLIANTDNIEFEGNTANGISNAIHSNGIINLWASDKASIIFKDRITSDYNISDYKSVVLNINTSTTTLPAIGKIILDEDMSDYKGDVNIHGGEVELQSKGTEINTNKFFSGNITFVRGTLNILNNSIDNITLSKWSSTINSNLKFDVNLRNNTNDNFTITGSVSGTLNLSEINIIDIDTNEKEGTITLFNNGKSPKLNVLTTANYGGYEYSFSANTIEGTLNYKYTNNKSFKEVIKDSMMLIKSYSLVGNEKVTENLENLEGNKLTIFGNDKEILGSNVDGIYVSNGQTLNINNVSNWKGFTNIYGAVKNNGNLNISGTNFSNNSEQDIINDGNLTLTDVSSSFEKGIIGIGKITIKNVSIDLADAVIEQNKILINNNGNLTAKAQNINGEIENNGSLNFYGGTNNNVITGTGLIQISDNVTNKANITQNNLEILTNKQLNNSTATITINQTLIINNNSKIINDGKFIINNGTNTGTIEQTINTSTISIFGNFINNGTIKQSKLIIEQTGELTTNASSIEPSNNLVMNNGMLHFFEGNNNNQITGTGTTIIDGLVTNNSLITNFVIINKNKKLTTNAHNINGQIENNGTLNFVDGTNNNVITGTGILEINNNIINNSAINQNTIRINNKLINSSQITTENIYVNGVLENNSNLTVINMFIHGLFSLGENGVFYNATNSILYNGAEINLQNKKIQHHNFGNLTINEGTISLNIDADLENKTIDTISATSFNGNGKINVKNINITKECAEENISIIFADETLKKFIFSSANNAYTSLYKYAVYYDNSTGIFKFYIPNNVDYNPITFENTIANQIGAYITQVNVVEQVLTNIDSQMAVVRNAKNKGNLYASNSNVIFKEKNSIEQGLWLRPYAVSEKINIDDIDIKNDAYGTVGGLDLQVANNMLASFYIGYTTSKQNYEEININQTGYVLGLTGSYIAENYYLALTANAIFNKAEAKNMFGTDNIENNSYTLAGKAGIDIKLNSKLTLQPNLLLMYSMINTADYINSQNNKITSDPATNLHIEPSLKLMLNLQNQFTPYAILSMSFNSNSSKVTMDDIILPEKEIGSYSDLGIGFEKNWKNWNMYLQATGRFGARQGFGIFGGLKYKFGKAKNRISSETKKRIQERNKEIKENKEYLKRQIEQEEQEIENLKKSMRE